MPFERQALYDVNIEIEDGSLVALIGHTGSGKSTLIQHFNALVKPTSGKIIINGIDVTAPKADLRLVRKTVGLVFQYPEHQLFEETVYKDIAFGPKNMGFSDEEIEEMILKFNKEGKSTSEIGIILRDQYGIPSVKEVTGERITQILKRNDQAGKYPEDLMNLIKRAVNIRDHLAENPKDLHSKRGLTIIESRIRRLASYYVNEGALPEGWRYNPKEAALLVK